ncbi:hypothetical protein MMC13_004392 [Lambiella insularis]|nr:hypothetical protein [Lambiella insularis]
MVRRWEDEASIPTNEEMDVVAKLLNKMGPTFDEEVILASKEDVFEEQADVDKEQKDDSKDNVKEDDNGRDADDDNKAEQARRDQVAEE